MLYELLLTIGGLGLTAQIALGFVHGGHGYDGHGEGSHGGHAHGDVAHGYAGHQGHSDTGHHEGHGHHDGHDSAAAMPRVTMSVLLWLSPLNLFSVALGTGVTGIALHSLHLGDWLTALLAASGGLAFLVFLVRPLWALILRFVSKPAETLAGVVTREGTAASRFDAQGRGVVRVTVDGQTVRILGLLDSDEREAGKSILPGDRLLVTGIDATRNHCRVTKL